DSDDRDLVVIEHERLTKRASVAEKVSRCLAIHHCFVYSLTSALFERSARQEPHFHRLEVSGTRKDAKTRPSLRFTLSSLVWNVRRRNPTDVPSTGKRQHRRGAYACHARQSSNRGIDSVLEA